MTGALLCVLVLIQLPGAGAVAGTTLPVATASPSTELRWAGDSTQLQVLGSFESGWRDQWTERTFADEATTYEVVDEDGMPVLQARADNAASWFMRRLEVDTSESTRIAWRWKVERTLHENLREREKQGDDYVARILVAFEPRWPQWRTRTICYVWSAHQPVGDTFENPFVGSVAMMVVRSGDAEAGTWVDEERDIMADYRRVFGEAPRQISAVCIMVDTDNTGSQATAWFDDIVLSVGP